MSIVYSGDFISGSHGGVGSFDVIAFDAPELMRDDSTDATHGGTGAEHEFLAGGRFKTGDAKVTIPYDPAFFAETPGTANGVVVAYPLSMNAVGMPSKSFADMVLKSVSPGQLKVKGGQPTMVLTFTKHNP